MLTTAICLQIFLTNLLYFPCYTTKYYIILRKQPPRPFCWNICLEGYTSLEIANFFDDIWKQIYGKLVSVHWAEDTFLEKNGICSANTTWKYLSVWWKHKASWKRCSWKKRKDVFKNCLGGCWYYFFFEIKIFYFLNNYMLFLFLSGSTDVWSRMVESKDQTFWERCHDPNFRNYVLSP